MAPLDPATPQSWADLAGEWQRAQAAWAQWWRSAAAPAAAPPAEAAAGPAAHAATDVARLNARLRERLQALWQAVADAPRHAGRVAQVVAPPPGDRRFHAPAWREQPFFSLLMQSYLLYADYLRELAHAAPLPPEERRRLEFATRQYVDAIAPTNFPATNPEVLAKAIATEGESLVQGLRNLADDAKRGRITMTDERAFAVGRNLAITPGSVVYRNELIELIQYDAVTPTVCRRPLLIVPPCINKYYILDLKPENSFVAWAVAQGHTVFMISWRNVPPEQGALTWDDYLERGVLAAIRLAREIAGSRTVNTLGFCVGGTLLASALAVLAARRDASVTSATLLTTMLDFADPGDIGVYVSRELLAAREPQLAAGERVHGGELASAFASLRANELVWNYVVGNYLKGETPPAFDLLYWNGDSANLPGPMYVYYLRNLYLDNRLREPGALTMLGERVDLSRIHVPVYVYASRDDHIVPWRAAYRTTALVGGDVSFVLGASGHIAGVVNPPQPPRRSYWTNDLVTDAPDDWLARAETVPGSWWPHWGRWLAGHGGPQRPAPRGAGSDAYPPLDPAPGRYVLAPA
ncbi:MAG: class I poly(R)-hydroxyalkanoic acid synthase [Betaproteobacteria bacterium]|nr:class I poly(R)-hydroxyalkanoic acid synthase [Betaproteobacteria bacterium]